MSGKTYKTTTDVKDAKPATVHVASERPPPRRQIAVGRLYREGRTLGMDCLFCGQSLSTEQERRFQERLLEVENQIRQHQVRHPGAPLEFSLAVDEIVPTSEAQEGSVACPFCEQEISEQQADTIMRQLHRFEGDMNWGLVHQPTVACRLMIPLQ